MFSHDEMRRIYGRQTQHIPLATLTNVPTTTTNQLAFAVPQNRVLKRVDVAVLTGDAAGSSLTAQVKRGTTVLASSGATAAGTGAATAIGAEVSAVISKNEQLIIAVLAANATDDFTGVVVSITTEPMHSDS